MAPPTLSRTRWATPATVSLTTMSISSSASPLLGPRSFGHGGAGGQLAFADADHEVGFAYVNNQMGGVPDERARLLVEAVRGCLAAGPR